MSASTFAFTIYLGSRPFFGQDAFVRLSRLCQKYCGPYYEIETIDVSADRRAAARAAIKTTPTIFVALQGQPRQRLGGLAPPKLFCTLTKQILRWFLPTRRSGNQSERAFRL